jgi:hypothetical protein
VATDLEWIAAPEMAEQRSYKGREGFVEFMRGWIVVYDLEDGQLVRLRAISTVPLWNLLLPKSSGLRAYSADAESIRGSTTGARSGSLNSPKTSPRIARRPRRS